MIELYRWFLELVETCGPVQVAPAKTRAGFQVQTIFAAVNRLGEDPLDAHVVLRRRIESPRFRRIETLSPTSHVHHFRDSHADESSSRVL